MLSHEHLKQDLQFQLHQLSDHKKKAWWENYVKHDSCFRGVGMPQIREEMKQWYTKNSLDQLPINQQLELALSFIAEKYAEDKLAGILLLQIYLGDKFDYQFLLLQFAAIFKKKYITDWNICDWFCVKVLRALIQKNGLPCARAIAKWNTAKNVWQARCSVVAFANLATEKKYIRLLLDSNKKLIARHERFAKTAVGWTLREVSKTDQHTVAAFIQENRLHFSKESLANAIKYFDKNRKNIIQREVFT